MDFYDMLIFGDESARPPTQQVQLNRPGGIWVQSSGHALPEKLVEDPWGELARTAVSIRAVRERVLLALEPQPSAVKDLPLPVQRSVRRRSTAYRAIAVAISLATSAGLRWEGRWGVHHTSEGRQVHADRFASYGKALAHVDRGQGHIGCEAEAYWFIADIDTHEPVLAVSTTGDLIRHGQRHVHDLRDRSAGESVRVTASLAVEAIDESSRERSTTPPGPLFFLQQRAHGMVSRWLTTDRAGAVDPAVVARATADMEGWKLLSAARSAPVRTWFEPDATLWAAPAHHGAFWGLESPAGRRHPL